jgi:hypothetical protein
MDYDVNPRLEGLPGSNERTLTSFGSRLGDDHRADDVVDIRIVVLHERHAEDDVLAAAVEHAKAPIVLKLANMDEQIDGADHWGPPPVSRPHLVPIFIGDDLVRQVELFQEGFGHPVAFAAIIF